LTGDAGTTSARDINRVAAVMSMGWPNVKTVDSVGTPCCTLSGRFKANDFHAGGGDWLVVKNVGPTDTLPSGNVSTVA